MDFTRRKRVTGPFNDEAKARLVGGDHRQLSYDSSGSEHSGTGDGDSPCLSELVHHFLEENIGNENDSVSDEFDSERVDSVADCMDSVEEALCRLSAKKNADSYMSLLHAHVLEAVNKFTFIMRDQKNAQSFRRNVMSFMREKGHNAAICKTRWDSSNGVTAGSHEFIDVVRSGPHTWQNRYFVDLDFASQFEIARPTSRYSEIVGKIPGIFVGNGEELKRTVRAMCEAAKRCLRSMGLSVPPWRKNRFMQNKWFGPYKRTMNPVPGNPVPAIIVSGVIAGAKCRMVGFDDAVSEARRGGVFVRTR